MSNDPKFKVALSKEAFKYYTKVSAATTGRLDKCFASLESEPTTGPNIKPLADMPGKYRYRISSLRIIYEIDLSRRVVSVLAILPRGDVYKK